MLIGRQNAYLIFQHFLISEVRETALKYKDMLYLTLVNDDLRSLDQGWDESLLSVEKKVPEEGRFFWRACTFDSDMSLH